MVLPNAPEGIVYAHKHQTCDLYHTETMATDPEAPDTSYVAREADGAPEYSKYDDVIAGHGIDNR
ncbi:hypothetical protein FRC12_007736 [Ceratobasidium sp. 428]|nr:hypothetical protein FRC12_007736 [Ceratobasidium sp. 428]